MPIASIDPVTPSRRKSARLGTGDGTSSNGRAVQERLDAAARSADAARALAEQEVARAQGLEEQLRIREAQIKELHDRLTLQQPTHSQAAHSAGQRHERRRPTTEDRGKGSAAPVVSSTQMSHSNNSSVRSSTFPKQTPVQEQQPSRAPRSSVAMEDVLRRLDRLDGERVTRLPPSFPRRQGPFGPLIRQAERPPMIKAPRLVPYIGESDPMGHMDAFELATIAQGYSDGLLCLLFVETLGGQVISWFLSLEENSILSFDDLRNAFLRRFKHLTESTISVAQLFHQQQQQDESLRAFLTRWLSTVGRCRNLDKQTALQAFRHCLLPGEFSFFLTHHHKNTPYDDILDIAVTYAEDEEETWGTPKARPGTSAARPAQQTQNFKTFERKGNVPARQEQRNLPARDQQRQGKDARSNANAFQSGGSRPVPVHTVDSPVLAWYEKYKHLLPPRQPRDPSVVRQEGRKWCDYHQDNQHDTAKCRTIPWQLEKLYRAGKIPHAQEVRSQETQKPADTQPSKKKQKLKKIHTISGGERIAGALSNRARKKLAKANDARLIAAVQFDRLAKMPKEGWAPITFEEEEGRSVCKPHADPMVISAILADEFAIQRVFLDGGSAVNIIYLHCYEKMEQTRPLYEGHGPLAGFSGETVMPLGSTSLSLEVGDAPRTARVISEFLVVDAFSPYNIILGRPAINQLGLILFGRHMLVKFPTPFGTGVIRVSPDTLNECHAITAEACYENREKEQCNVVTHDAAQEEPINDPRSLSNQYSPTEPADVLTDVRPFSISVAHPERMVNIGVQLSKAVAKELEELLIEKAEVFAWSYADMPGISPEVITHKLNIFPTASPVRQRTRLLDKERADAILEQVSKLKQQNFIRTIYYPAWLANPVLVAKKDGKWRMCIDYTNLNKACPKDSFPLPRIDALVDATAGHALMSMMDAYSGYNQIRMDPEDEEATAFMTRQGLYCWQVMPFGLKNAGATYQRLMTKMFAPHLGREIEVYIDDMLVKSKTEGEHVTNLRIVLDVLLNYKMRLNPLKCYFGVVNSKFLGYIVSARGINANPDKVQAIINMEVPRTKKDIQILDGRLVSLARFIARLTDKCRPFFKCLTTHAKLISWTTECEEAFNNIKAYLANVPQLAIPIQGSPLYLYLAISETATSAALILKEGAEEKPVYYAGRAMVPAETRYPILEQVALALVVAARRLRNYFQAHAIIVLTDTQLKQVLQNPDRSGRLSKWAVELSEFDIQFQPRTAYKGQAVADFIAEHTKLGVQADQAAQPAIVISPWKLYVDGSSCSQHSGAGIVLESPEGETIEYALKFDFPATNNEAEYEALIAGMLLARENQVQHLNVFSDSQLVINQVNGVFQVHQDALLVYVEYVSMLRRKFTAVTFEQIPRLANVKADALARLATEQFTRQYTGVRVEHLSKPCRDKTLAEVCMIGPEAAPWMNEIVRYKKDGHLPPNKLQARTLIQRAQKYFLMDDRLYRKGDSHPHMRCVTKEEGQQILRSLHSGLCGNHTGARALVCRVMRTGYFWLTMKQDAQDFVRKCTPCQEFANFKHTPSYPLVNIMSPWIHAVWGLDLIGQLPTAKGQLKYIIVAVDYFSKWVEAEALACITTAKITRFLWRNVYCRYGVPHTIITDNGTQFNNPEFISFARGLGTTVRFASVAHPQANGQVEAVNKKIMQLLKKSLGDAKGLWAEKLPEVLWALRTTPTEATGRTPFSLLFGSECVLPIEQAFPTARVIEYDKVANDSSRRLDLDLLEEDRVAANIRNLQHKQRIARFYNARVREKQFYLGDLVMKKIIPTPAKLRPQWEGPFQISEVLGKGTYKLSTLGGRELPRSWNAQYLKDCYKE